MSQLKQDAQPFELTEIGKQKIAEFKKAIIMKKIMLNYVIDSYAWWDKTYRWGHVCIALSAFALGTADKIIGANNVTANLYVILAGITAVMVKAKDYVKFDKIRDLSKEQTTKYKQLFERIDRELMKPERKQLEDDFIYWISREFNNIEMSDPELSHSERRKFILDCKSKGIPYDSDVELLNQLAITTSQPNTPRDVSNVVHVVNIQSNQLSPGQPSQTFTRIRSLSDERDRQNYKLTLKTLNTRDDLQWAMERLNRL